MTHQNLGLPFSQRYGLAPVPTVPSVDEVSQDLQTDLLNAVLSTCAGSELALRIWAEFLHQSITDAPRVMTGINVIYRFPDVLDSAKLRFQRSPRWWVYDLIEFICRELDDAYARAELHKELNRAFERDFAAVRMVDGLITPITDEQQSEEIRLAMQTPLAGVQTQLRSALALMSDRQEPKYGDSIKNSISAVETLCRKITGRSKVTLGDALKQLKDSEVRFHPALARAFGEMYGYTSDDTSGIRHAMMDEGHLELEDARYMLVTCSAFINYLVVKADKAGIKLETQE